MLEIYAIAVSLYCAKTRILLRHKRLEWNEIPPPGGYGSDEYKTVVPSGNLPALRHGDLLIGDSEATAEYLEETYPDPTALPGDAAERALVRERSRFHDTRLEPALRALFPYLPGRAQPPRGRLSEGSAELSARLAQFANLLSQDPDAGATLTLAECGFPITFAWMDAMQTRMDLEISWPDAVRSYRERLMALPPVAAEVADYVPKLTDFLDG